MQREEDSERSSYSSEAEDLVERLRELDIQRESITNRIRQLRNKRRNASYNPIPIVTGTGKDTRRFFVGTIEERIEQLEAYSNYPIPRKYWIYIDRLIRDVEGRVISIGDRVHLIRTTSYDTITGTVAYFTQHRVTIVDSRGNKISKNGDGIRSLETEA